MKGKSLLALGACFLLASCAEPASAPEASNELTPAFARGGRVSIPGAQQPKVDLTRGFTWAIFPVGAGQNLAQTFSPTKNLKLRFIELPVGCEADVHLNIKIRDGIGGTILFEANAAGLPEIVDGSFQLIQVFDPMTSNGIKIRKDSIYAFELAAFPNPLVPGNPNLTCGMAPGPAGDSYSRGEGYFEDVPTNGAGWLALGEDLPFITLVR